MPIVGPVGLVDAGGGTAIGFLGALQQQPLATTTGQPLAKIASQDDDSVVVVQAETPTLADHWLATQLATDRPTLLVTGGDGARLDAQLAAARLPRQGLKETSAFRPALQVLPLALELLWTPLNYAALMQFLTHPCPIPGYARRRLAADAPGIGGDYWHRTARIDEHYGEDKAPQIREQITTWIEHTRFPSDVGCTWIW